MLLIQDTTTGELQWVQSMDNYAGHYVQLAEVPEETNTDLLHWDGTQLVDNLAIARERRWAYAKLVRESKRYNGCMTPKGRMQNDPASKMLINGAVTMSMLDTIGTFSINWTMEDNSVVPHNAAEIQAAGQAIGQYDAQVFGVGEQLRAALDAATTIADINAVDIDGAPWPA